MLDLESTLTLPGHGFEALPARWRADSLVCLHRRQFRQARVVGDDDGVVILTDGDHGTSISGYGDGAVAVLTSLLGEGLRPRWLDLPRSIPLPQQACDALRVTPNPGWDFLVTTTPPPAADGPVERLDLVGDLDAIRACLGEANPTTDADPEHPDEVGWWGVREHGRLLGVLGANRRGGADDDAESWHLHGLGVVPSARQRGLGARLTATVTRLGLEAGASWVCLGAWADNRDALRIYHRLGFTTAHRRRSYRPVPGPLG